MQGCRLKCTHLFPSSGTSCWSGRCRAGRRVAEGPAVMPGGVVPREHQHCCDATTGRPVATSPGNHLLLARMFGLTRYLQGAGRAATAGPTPPLRGSVLTAAPAGLSAFPCLRFPSCPPGYAPGSHLCDSADRPTAAARDTSGARPLAPVSTPAFFPCPN